MKRKKKTGQKQKPATKKKTTATTAEHEQLLSIFDGIDEVVYIADPKTYELLYLNKACKKLFPVKPGIKCYRAFQGRSDPCPYCTNKYIFGKNIGKTHIWEFQNKKNRRWYRCIDRAIKWPDGRWVRYEMAVDITDSKMATEELKAKEQFFRALIEGSSDLVIITDKKGTINYVSPSVKSILGYSQEELLGKSGFKLIHPAELPRAISDYARAIKTKGRKVSDCFSIRRKDGSYRILDGVGRNMFDDPAINGFVMNVRDVTEQRKAEAEKEIFRRFAENAGQGFGMADREGNVTYVNRALCRMFGEKKAGDCYRKNLRDYYPKENYERFAKKIVPILKKEGQWTGESKILSAKGRITPVIENIFVMRDDEGNFLSYANVLTDIAERKKAEEELRKSEQRLKLATYAGNVGLFDWNLKTNEVYFSPEWKRQIGYEENEISNNFNEWQSRVCPDDLDKTLKKIKSYIKDPHPNYEVEFRLRHKNGSYRWIMAQASLLKDERGKPVRMMGSHIDITERKETEEIIRKANERMSYLLATISTAIYTAEAGGDYGATFITDNVRKISGHRPGDFIGDPGFWARHIHPEDRERILKNEVPQIFKKEGHDYEYRFLHKSGKYIWIHDYAKVVRDSSGKPDEIVGTWTDVTLQKEAEQMQATLLRDVTHSLKSPIAVSRMALYMLKKGMAQGDPGQMKEAYRIVDGNLDLLKKDIDNLLVSATLDTKRLLGKEPWKRKRCSLKKAAGDMIKSMENMARERGVKFDVDIARNANTVAVDKNHMKILMNGLFDNAVKFTKKGRISLSARIKAGKVEIKIKDTGCGIEKKHIGKVFERFYKRHPAVHGTGLGLSIAKDIVDMYKGKITVESRGRGKGTTVTVVLPKG